MNQQNPINTRICIRTDQIDPSLSRYVRFGDKQQRWYNGEKQALHTASGELVGYRVYCVVKEGDAGDEDGYDVEPDYFAVAFRDGNGVLVSPYFDLYSDAYRNFADQWGKAHGVSEVLSRL